MGHRKWTFTRCRSRSLSTRAFSDLQPRLMGCRRATTLANERAQWRQRECFWALDETLGRGHDRYQRRLGALPLCLGLPVSPGLGARWRDSARRTVLGFARRLDAGQPTQPRAPVDVRTGSIVPSHCRSLRLAGLSGSPRDNGCPRAADRPSGCRHGGAYSGAPFVRPFAAEQPRYQRVTWPLHRRRIMAAAGRLRGLARPRARDAFPASGCAR